MSEITYYLERDDDSVELTVTGTCTPEVAASFRGHPDNWTPVEGGDCEIEEIIDAETDEPWTGTLTPAETKEVLIKLAQQSKQDADEAETELAVDAYEARMTNDDDYGLYGYQG